MRKTISVDKDKCIGCFACVVACKLEHNLPPHPVKPPIGNPEGPKPIRIIEVGPKVQNGEIVEHYFQAVVCNHCVDPPCIEECPNSAIYIGEDDITLVDKDKCDGCKVCLEVCPYEAPQFDSDNKLVLCDLCIQRLGEGKKPICVTVCPAEAISITKPN